MVHTMSTPNETPLPEQGAGQPATPPPPGYGSQPDPALPGQPPAPPPGYQQPAAGQPYPGQPYPQPGYQQQPPPPYQGQQPPSYPGQPGWQQQPPHQQQQPAGDFSVGMPRDLPKSFRDVMPVDGLGGIFRTDGLPQLLKVSYFLWLATAALWLFFTFFGFLGALFMLGSRYWRGEALVGIITSFVAVALIAAVVVCGMKLKEGRQWARMALSAIVLIGFVLMALGSNGGGLLGVVAAVLMWLPESTAWLNARAKGQA